nr:ribonuclease H-like domain-containing protein [Tanacetum cinerariifolium]
MLPVAGHDTNVSDFAKRKVAIYEKSDPFETYSQLYARNVRPRDSSDITQFKQTTDAFQKYKELYSSHAGPSVSNQRKRTGQSSKITRASNETDTSKRVCRPEASTKGIVVRRQTRRPLRLGGIHAEGSSSGHGRGPSLVYDDLGDCAHQCQRCGAAFWTYGLVISSFDVIILEISIPSPNRQQSLPLSSPQAPPRGTSALVIPLTKCYGLLLLVNFSRVMPLVLDFTTTVLTLPYLFFIGDLSLAGGLQYLIFTRRDISYAVRQICLYKHDPRKPHLAALKRILRYIQGTLDFGFHLYSSTTNSLVGYTDADWAGCPSTRRTTLAETAWLHNPLRELHSPLSTATLVYCDNVSATYLSANPVQHQRTKHIEIDIHFVCDLVTAGQVRVLHVPSRYPYAYIFTKGLPSALFEDFRSSLSIRLPPARTAAAY